MNILVLNAGSSSQKSCLYQLQGSLLPDHAPQPIWSGSIDWGRQAGQGELKAEAGDQTVRETISADNHAEGIPVLLQTLIEGSTQVLQSFEQIDIIGHRVVHGGQTYQEPVVITAAVKDAIQDLSALAPAHNPANLAGIQVCEAVLPTIPQVAVFDTAFHAHMPAAATTYPGSYEWLAQGLRRYGFHGLSHEYCSHRIQQVLAARNPQHEAATFRILTCHLGNGCSLAAIRGDHSVDTTMGLTPLEGLMMGSRSGSIDPGLLIHLLKQGMEVKVLDHLLNRDSGLKGLSGLSSDMRTVLAAAEQGDSRARLALEVYLHRLRREMGGMIASLGGLDCLLFTGGVGENAPWIRERACQGFEFLGLRLDPARNAAQGGPEREISAPDSTIPIWVIHTEEDWVIAKACARLHSAEY